MLARQHVTRRVLPILTKRVTHLFRANTLRRLFHGHEHGPECFHDYGHKSINPSTIADKEHEHTEVDVQLLPIEKYSQKEIDDALRDCHQTLRVVNPEQEVIATRLEGVDMKNLYSILHSLNAELAKIKSVTTNPSTGMLRMSWWKTYTAAAIKGTPPRVPVLIALSHYAKKYNIKMTHLRNVFKWRELDLRWKQAPDLASIEGYSEGIYSSLLYILLDAAGTKSVEIDHIASHLGKAYGLCILIRGTCFHSYKHQTYLPADVCARHGVTEDMIYARQNTKQIADAVFEIADVAKAHLDAARKLADTVTVPTNVQKILQVAIFTDMFLHRLQKVNFDIYHDYVASPELMKAAYVFNLIKAGFWGSYLGSLTK